MALTAAEQQELATLESVQAQAQAGVTGEFAPPGATTGVTGGFAPTTGFIRRQMSPDELRMSLGEPSIGEAALVGLGAGFTRAAQGVGQLGLLAGEKLGLVDPETLKQYTREVQAERELFGRTPVGQTTTGGIGEVVGEALPYLAIPGGVAGGVATRAATGAGAGLLAGATQFVPEGESRLQNIATGGLLGAALPGIGAGVSRALGRTGVPGLAEREAALALGEAHKVPVLGPDIAGPAAKKLGVLSEQLPLGLAKPRIRQAQAAKEAAQRIVDKEFDNLNNTKFDLDEISKIAATPGNPKQDAANRLLKELGSADDDWKKIVQQSGKVNLLNREIVANKMYQAVTDLSGDTAVPYTQTMQAIDNAMQKAVGSGDQRQVRLINRIRDRFVDPDGNPVTTNFNQLRQRRTTIGDDISAQYTGKGDLLVGGSGAALLQPIKKAIDLDLEDFAVGSGGKLKRAWLDADKYYKENVIPFKNKQIARAFANEDPNKVVAAFIKKSTTPQEARNFYNALDPKGKAAVQYGIVDSAMREGVNELPTGGVTFSPARFARTMESLDASKNQFYGKQMREKLDGFTKLMRITQRAGQVAENPPTGFRTTQALISGAAVGSVFSPAIAKAAALGIGLNGVMRYLWTTNAGTKLLIKAAKSKTGAAAKKEFDKLLEKEVTTGRMQRVLRATAINETNKQLQTREPRKEE